MWVSTQGEEPGSVHMERSVDQYARGEMWVSTQGEKPGSVHRERSVGQYTWRNVETGKGGWAGVQSREPRRALGLKGLGQCECSIPPYQG